MTDDIAGGMYTDKVVLVVEDEAFTREMVGKMVERLGPSVLMAENGQQGYALCQEKKPDAVICDIAMKPVNGLQFLTRVRSDDSFFNNQLPVIFLTNAADVNVVQKAQNLKANGYIVKPISPKTLEQHLQAVFGG